MILPECFAFYPEKFFKFSRTLFRKCLYPKLLNSSINFTKLFFSVFLTYLISTLRSLFFLVLRITTWMFPRKVLRTFARNALWTLSANIFWMFLQNVLSIFLLNVPGTFYKNTQRTLLWNVKKIRTFS